MQQSGDVKWKQSELQSEQNGVEFIYINIY